MFIVQRIGIRALPENNPGQLDQLLQKITRAAGKCDWYHFVCFSNLECKCPVGAVSLTW